MNDSIGYHLKPLHDLSAWLQGFTVLSLSIGPFGELCVLAVNEVPERIGGMTLQSATTRPFTYILFISKNGEATKITLPDQYWHYNFLQPIQRDYFLLTACRAHRYKDGTFDKNAKIFDREGNLVREFLLGDGIECLQVTKEDSIWTGYSDDGVFGNFGGVIPQGIHQLEHVA